MTTFKERRLDIQFKLASNNPGGATFGDTGSNQVRISGLRISSKVVKAGGVSISTMQATVFGLTKGLMNQLSTLGMRIQLVPRNEVTLFAGDTEGNMKMVFQGTITQAYADMNSAPDVGFQIQAHVGAAEAVLAIPATSYKGGVDVATVMQRLADQMGFTFENNNVSVQLADPYFSGSAREQAAQAAAQANISWTIDNGILAIWPKGGSRKAPQTFVLSPDTGMINYPAYTAQGIMVRCLFNPDIRFGGLIEVKSDLKPACGKWAVYGIEHDLDARVYNGKWQSTLQCFNPEFAPPLTR